MSNHVTISEDSEKMMIKIKELLAASYIICCVNNSREMRLQRWTSVQTKKYLVWIQLYQVRAEWLEPVVVSDL